MNFFLVGEKGGGALGGEVAQVAVHDASLGNDVVHLLHVTVQVP